MKPLGGAGTSTVAVYSASPSSWSLTLPLTLRLPGVLVGQLRLAVSEGTE